MQRLDTWPAFVIGAKDILVVDNVAQIEREYPSIFRTVLAVGNAIMSARVSGHGACGRRPQLQWCSRSPDNEFHSEIEI